jgi:hypothetical protein
LPGRDPGLAVAPGRVPGCHRRPSPAVPHRQARLSRRRAPVQPPLSASLTAFPAVNLAALDAAIVIGAPVWGLRP